MAEVWSEAMNHLGLVNIVAREFRGLGIDHEDLCQEALIAVCRSIDGHDPAQSKFSTYASMAIRNHLMMVIDRQAHPVYLPHYVAQLVRKASRGRIDVDTLSPIRRRCLLEAIRAGTPVAGSTGTWTWNLPDRGDRLDADTLAEVDAAMGDCLTPREAFVVRSWYGLDGPKLTPAAIGHELGIGAAWTGVIKARALALLRERLVGCP